ncbi:MAG: chemotaxis protein CheB [Gemmatimonadales bacterium]
MTRPVLVVDDDELDAKSVARALATLGLSARARFVTDGEQALDYLRNRGQFAEAERYPRPALVLLDLNMPRMNGYELLSAIRAEPEFADVPVVVMSTSSRGLDQDRCRELGAADYLVKPDNFEDLVAGLRHCGRHLAPEERWDMPGSKPSFPAPPESGGAAAVRSPSLVCVGASAGGLEALEVFFERVPADLGVAFLVVVHLSPEFKSLMPELIGRRTSMPVLTIDDGMVPEANAVYFIPPSKNVVWQEGRLRLQSQDRTTHTVQLPIDVLLRSVAASPGAPSATAVILSGSGTDGSRGVRDLKDAGGTVLVQSPESARFDGMPRSALDTGSADGQGDPADLAAMLKRVTTDRSALLDGDAAGDDVRQVVDVLLAHQHVDLGYLRSSMLRRRILRRMTLLGEDSVSRYVERLELDPLEARALIHDTMIGVTGFFRDPAAFDLLQAQLAAGLLRCPEDEQFRVWVPACATGEEVYTIGMLILEALQVNGLKRDVKIFATDIDEESLALAGRGTYPISVTHDIGPARASRYFTLGSHTVAARQELREMIVFARHNLVKDPPFTRIDLVSCRNLLIYLNPEAHHVALVTLHFALKRGGLLLLGTAENLGDLESEFEVLDARNKLFRRTGTASFAGVRTRGVTRDPPFVVPRRNPGSRDHADGTRSVLQALAAADGRTIAVLSPDGALLELIADGLGLFRIPVGRPSTDALRLLAESHTVGLTTGLQRLRRGEDDIRYLVPPGADDTPATTLLVRRIPPGSLHPERVLFVAGRDPSATASADLASLPEASSARLAELHSELLQTRESLQASIEELQSANEEQQSTNEELIASNEELQSTNEELQSVNEELFTVNIEYQKKHQELAVLAADLHNLLHNIHVGVLFLSSDLTIRRFTPAIEPIVPLREQDVGRSIEHFAHNLGPEFVTDVRTVVETGQLIERETRSLDGAWLLLRIRPYLAGPDQPQGVVATFFDVTALKNAHELARAGSLQLAAINQELTGRREELEEMFSIVAHDLKRPVLALDGLLWLMADGASDPDQTGDLLARAQAECSRMRQMLFDLASIAGIRQRDLTVETVSLQPWIDELVERFQPEAERRGVRVNCTSDTGRYAIPTTFLGEILGNLIENALKYGSTGDQPRLDLSCRVIDDMLEVSVADNGAGIAPENQNRVFEPFRRLNPAVADGSGIGLLAVKRLLQRLGGSIVLTSQPGEGAKFTARVPLPRATGGEANAAVRQPRVLLVEDDDLDAKVIARHLGTDYVLTRCQTMAQAETELRQTHFDLVLLDLSLPDGHGLELISRVRELLGRSVGIVVISGHGDGVDRSNYRGLIGGYLSKSDLTPEGLLDEVSRATRSLAASS